MNNLSFYDYVQVIKISHDELVEKWEKVVGEEIAKTARAHDIGNEEFLYVVCENALVASEMKVFKRKIMEALFKEDVFVRDILFSINPSYFR